MNEQDFDYFAQRAREEQEAAERTDHSEAKRAHQRLAEQYVELARLGATQLGLASDQGDSN